MDFPYPSRSDAAGNRRTPRGGVCARGERQSHALRLYCAWRGDHWSGRANLFFERQGGLERHDLRTGWDRLDCLGNHDLWRVESLARRVWRISFFFLTVAGACTSAEPSEYPLA